MPGVPLRDPSRQGAFSCACHSIRTRYSLVTAFLLLSLLGVFYIGGRVVLVHMMHDAGEKVREIGLDVRRLTMRDAKAVHWRAGASAAAYAGRLVRGEDAPLIDLLGGRAPAVSLVLRFDADGAFEDGCAARGGVLRVEEADLAAYAGLIPQWTRQSGATNLASSIGVLRVLGRSDYAAIVRYGAGEQAGYLVLGTPFDSQAFAAHVNDALSGLEVRVTDRRHGLDVPTPGARQPAGISPMLSEALNFYSGGFWDLKSGVFEAVFTIRDIAGNPVTMLAVSLPNTFSSVTAIAISRLTLFISIAGIVLIIPIFWMQGRLLLNPLSEMTGRIRQIGERHDMTDCPRLDWQGRDEFAQLALSVNAMLETISRRSVAIAHAEARQKAIIACVPDALAVFDRGATLVSFPKPPASAAGLPGFSEGAPVEWGRYGPDAEGAFQKALREAFSGGAVSRLKLNRAPAGGLGPGVFEIRLARLDDHFALATIRDATTEARESEARAEAERRGALASKQESMAHLAAGIAHDINNVLSVILSTVELALADVDDPVALDAQGIVRDAIGRGSAMTKELMTYAGETKIVLSRCDPSCLLREAERLAHGLVGPSVSVVCDLPDGLPAVDADPNQIWKVFLNLIKNAAEAMKGRTGELRVSTRAFEMTPEAAKAFHSVSPLRLGRGVLFSVADTGPGVPRELVARLFDPYVSTKEGGRGLGLATVGAIVEAHSGGVSVESSPGRGTAFRIFLPESRQPAAEAAPAPDAAEAGGDGRRAAPGDEVLLVDDDPAILKTTSILIQASGLKPIAVSGSAEAVAAFRRHSSSLRCVLLDAHVEKVDTVRLVAAFRATDGGVPIVVSSGSAEEAIAGMFETQPYDAFLAKPYTLAEFRAMLAAFGGQ